MKLFIIPMAVVALLSGCATTAETAKSVTSTVAAAGKTVATKTVDTGKAVASKVTPSAGKQDMMAMMKHANPVPNYMRIVVMHGDDLDLTTEQSNQLAKWREKSHHRVNGLVNEVIEGEKALKQASMENKSREEMNQMAQAVMEKRLAIIDVKTRYRDNMRKILNDKQWNKVVETSKAKS